MKKKILLAIFAHPDDECFGPGGTLALLAETYDVHIIFVSRGEAGELDEGIKTNDLGKHRQHETECSATELGIKKIYFLNFHDGLMCNDIYHDVVREIETILCKLNPMILLTFEPRGLSGHLDHVLVSSVTTFIYEKFTFIKELYYFCIDEKQRNAIPSYFIHFPPGYKRSQIDKSIDVSSVWEKKMRAINVHRSQQKDSDFYKGMLEASEKLEHFLVLKR